MLWFDKLTMSGELRAHHERAFKDHAEICTLTRTIPARCGENVRCPCGALMLHGHTTMESAPRPEIVDKENRDGGDSATPLDQ